MIQVLLILQAYSKQEILSHGGFHYDFKGNRGRSGNVWQHQELCRHFLRGLYMSSCVAEAKETMEIS
jgi:sarcosine oxidase delta subunit